MPLYEYECDACGHRFERIQKFSDALVSTCPECYGAVRKLLSSPAIRFKGTGWYVTDYAKKPADGQAATNGKDSAKSQDSDSAADSKSSSSTPPSGDAKGATGSKTGSSSSSASSAAS